MSSDRKQDAGIKTADDERRQIGVLRAATASVDEEPELNDGEGSGEGTAESSAAEEEESSRDEEQEQEQEGEIVAATKTAPTTDVTVLIVLSQCRPPFLIPHLLSSLRLACG